MANKHLKIHRISIVKTSLIFIGILTLFYSCVTTKKTTYMQEYDESDYPAEYVAPESYRIQINDNLFIRVTTPDPKWSNMFNTIPITSSAMSVGEQAIDILSYPVKTDGTVELPYLGSFDVMGLTVQEAKRLIGHALTDYVSDASISVKLVNNYVSILGEVNMPGRYPIYKEQMNIFQALAMAGDLGSYSNRQKLKIVRQTTDGSIIKEFDIKDINLIDSEFYYVMPNDVIYAQPMKGKFFGMESFPFVLILSTITTFILVANYIQ